MPDAETLHAIARDAIGLIGIAAVTYGVWLIYPPAGFITGGTLAVAASILLSMGS